MSQEDVKRAMQNYATKPIGDTTKWYREQYARAGLRWSGTVNADAPLNHQEEIARGLIPELDKDFFPTWVKCQLCGIEWQTFGVSMSDYIRRVVGMSEKYKTGLPTVCQPCADAWDARGGPPPGFYMRPPEEEPEPQEPPTFRKPYQE